MLATFALFAAPLHAGDRSSASRSDEEQVAPAGQNSRDPQRGFLPRLGRDFTHFVRPCNLAILGAGGLAAIAVHSYDRQLTADLSSSSSLDGFFEIGDVAGDGYVQGGAALGAYILGRLSHSPRVTELGGDLIRAQIVSGTVTTGIKLLARRERPDGSDRLSFPSGHTSASFATAAVLDRHFGWKAAVPAYVLATYIGVSRLQANKHFASDVLFGAGIGIAAGRGVTFDVGRRRVALAPLMVPGGLGIAVVSVGR